MHQQPPHQLHQQPPHQKPHQAPPARGTATVLVFELTTCGATRFAQLAPSSNNPNTFASSAQKHDPQLPCTPPCTANRRKNQARRVRSYHRPECQADAASHHLALCTCPTRASTLQNRLLPLLILPTITTTTTSATSAADTIAATPTDGYFSACSPLMQYMRDRKHHLRRTSVASDN
jgi:hypothetical protein